MLDIKIWLIVLLCFLILDGIWLGVIQKGYLKMVIDRLNPTESLKNSLQHPIWSFAIVYLLMTLSLTYFVLNDKNKSKKQIYLEAFLLGLTIYATFDFTMLNLTGGWTVYDAFKDTTWGVVVFITTTFVVLQLKSGLPRIFHS
jgi:uncharacterized membrane protein